jgi:hypothetical protein
MSFVRIDICTVVHFMPLSRKRGAMLSANIITVKYTSCMVRKSLGVVVELPTLFTAGSSPLFRTSDRSSPLA